MNQTKQVQRRPIRVEVVFRAYAVLVVLASLALLLWGRQWFPQSMGVRSFSAAFLLAASFAAALSLIGDAAFRRRNLFWFAVAHLALWISGLLHAGWASGSGLPDKVIALSAGTAFLLFYAWLAAEGEFRYETRTGLPPVAFFGARATNKVMSQYERKIRQAAAQEERNRLARDLHDSIKQQIFAIQTAAATAQARFTGDADGALEALEQIRGSAREAMTEMEVMLDQLRAEPLESTGLASALKKLCESIGFRTGAQVEFKLGAVPPNEQLSPVAAEATLRVAQEALANVARHARAAHVTVTLDSAYKRMELTVKDDGAGFDAQRDSAGMGTANMRARAEELGGSLDLASSPDHGTTVKFSIPVRSSGSGSRGNQSHMMTLVLLLWLALASTTRWNHWSFAPALIYITALAVAHYVHMARLNDTL